MTFFSLFATFFVPLHPIMKMTRKIFIITTAIVMAACGSSRSSVVKPTVVVDSKPLVADTVVSMPAADEDADTAETTIVDSALNDTTITDSIRLVRATQSWKRDIRNGIDDLLDSPLLTTSVCAMEVWDLDDDECLYRHNELQRLRPASTLKVITAVTALKELGDDYNFTTRVAYTGSEPDSVHTWHGDIYIIGGMNPRMRQSDIAGMAKAIRQLGVDSIMGTIYADQSFKDDKKWGAGWCWDDDENPLLLPLKYNNKDKFTDVFISKLREAGIYVSGGQGTKSYPGGGKVIAENRRSLKSIMRPMLKNSNNNCAEAVFYAMTHSRYGNGASASHGERIIRSTMADAGIDNAASYDIVDGSGLSLYDYVSPHAEVMMLRYAWKNHDIYKTLYPLLPVAAGDGTLRKRMHGTKAALNVHAKTGTVTGVRSLCGYVTAPNGHHLAFSIINQGVNGSDGTANSAKHLQDEICELLSSK